MGVWHVGGGGHLQMHMHGVFAFGYRRAFRQAEELYIELVSRKCCNDVSGWRDRQARIMN